MGWILFRGCAFTGSEGGFTVYDDTQAAVVFDRCRFGEQESLGLIGLDSVTVLDCSVSYIRFPVD
jgi:hypothetical protein